MRQIAFAFVLLLGGCLVTGDHPIIVDSLCATSSSALTVLTVQKAKGELNASQIELVDQAVAIIDPVCGAPSRPSDLAAIESLENALLILQGVKGV